MDLQTVHITMPLADEGSSREASTLASMKTDACKKTTAQTGVQTDQQIHGTKRDKQAERAVRSRYLDMQAANSAPVVQTDKLDGAGRRAGNRWGRARLLKTHNH